MPLSARAVGGCGDGAAALAYLRDYAHFGKIVPTA